jgi:HEXXH motif-containing protein
MRTHGIPSALFDELAAGRGELRGVLRAGQLSRRVLMLRQVRQMAGTIVPGLCKTAGTDEAFAVLAGARRTAGSAVDTVLLHPHVGTWLDGALRSLLTSGDIEPVDLGHLGNVTAAAAHASGQPFSVTTAIRDGTVPLPGLGVLRVPDPSGWCRLRSDDGTTFEATTAMATTAVSPSSSSPSPDWLPLRRITGTAERLTVELELDDIDPFRGCGGLPIDGRLDDSTAASWQQHLDQAWPLLVEHHRRWAEAIADGLSTVVPLRSTDRHPELSGSCHGAVGAVSMTRPTSPLGLALALAHEHQHNKLWALMDLVPLLRPSSDRDQYSPWKADPRPWIGLLHGAYAFLGLADMWRVQRHRPEGAADGTDVAHFEFALARAQVRHGVDVLQGSGLLTEAGARFVLGMSRRLAEHEQAAVDRRFVDLADLALSDHATSWRLRNVRPEPDQVHAWAVAWAAGRPRPREPIPTEVVDGGGSMPSLARRDLVTAKLGRPAAGGGPPPGAGDRLLLEGRDDEAAGAYAAQVEAHPEDSASWAGLAIAWRSRGTAACRGLAEAPEVVAAVYRAILERSGQTPALDEVADWLVRPSDD